MPLNFDIGIFVALGLVTALFLLIAIPAAWLIRPRKTVALGVQSVLGKTHILPGEGHVAAEDCVCHPRVDGLPGSEFVEHHPLGTMQR